MNSLPEFTRTALPLVTVCRNVQNGKTSYVVFSILITKHKELIISTRELSQAVHNQLEELELDPERCAKVVQNFDAVDSGIRSIVDFPFQFFLNSQAAETTLAPGARCARSGTISQVSKKKVKKNMMTSTMILWY